MSKFQLKRLIGWMFLQAGMQLHIYGDNPRKLTP